MRLQQKARWFDGYHFKSKKSRNISKENALLASLGYSREVRRVEIGKPVDLLLQGAGWSANVLFQVLKDLNIQVLVLS